MFVAIYEDGSPMSREEWDRVIEEEGYSKCYVNAGLQKGFVVVVEDEAGFEIRASFYYDGDSMMGEIAEIDEDVWEGWCK